MTNKEQNNQNKEIRKFLTKQIKAHKALNNTECVNMFTQIRKEFVKPKYVKKGYCRTNKSTKEALHRLRVENYRLKSSLNKVKALFK